MEGRIPAAQVRGVVFDLDGTLIDSYDGIADALNSALAALGRPPQPADRVRVMVGRGVETLLARAMGPEAQERPGLIEEGVRLFRERYAQVCVSGSRLLPGAEATLRALRGRGYHMAVATNKPARFAVPILEALGAAACLEAVVGPEQVARLKPDPEMVLTALRAMGLSARGGLYVGDMPVDVQTARAAGVPVVAVTTGSSTPEELRAARPDAMAPSLGALLDLLPGPLVQSPPS